MFFISMMTSVWGSKKQNSFRFWYIYTCLIVHLHRWKSLSFRGGVPSVQPSLDLLCRLLLVPLPCCLSVGERGQSRSASSALSRWGESFGYVHIHGRSMALTHSSTISSGPGHTPAGRQRSKETGWDKLNKTGWGAVKEQRKEGRMDRELKKNQTSRPTGTYWSIRSTGTHFVSCSVPADLKDAPSSSVTVDQRSSLQKHRKMRRNTPFNTLLKLTRLCGLVCACVWFWMYTGVCKERCVCVCVCSHFSVTGLCLGRALIVALITLATLRLTASLPPHLWSLRGCVGIELCVGPLLQTHVARLPKYTQRMAAPPTQTGGAVTGLPIHIISSCHLPYSLLRVHFLTAVSANDVFWLSCSLTKAF